MAAKLLQFLSKIQSDRMVDELEYHASEALNTFDIPSRVTHWDHYQDCLSRFTAHVDSFLLNGRPPYAPSLDLGWDAARQALKDLYGPQGDKKAMMMALTGVEGGITQVLRGVAEKMIDAQVKRSTTAAVNLYLESLSLEEMEQAAEEYLAHFGHLLPTELTEKHGSMLRIKFREVLIEHPRFMHRFRRAISRPTA